MNHLCLSHVLRSKGYCPRSCRGHLGYDTVFYVSMNFSKYIWSLSSSITSQPSYETEGHLSLTYLLTYILTYSMVQSPSWEANWFAASQEIPRISRNPKVHYRTHKRPPPVPILGQPNPVHIPTSHLLEIRRTLTTENITVRSQPGKGKEVQRGQWKS